MPVTVQTTLDALQNATGAQPYGSPYALNFSRICIRYQSISGADDFYFALRQPGQNIQHAMTEALRQGVGGLLCDEPPEFEDHQATVLIIGDVYRAALDWFSSLLRNRDIVTLLVLGASDNGLTARTTAAVLDRQVPAQSLTPPTFTLQGMFGAFTLNPETQLLVVDTPRDTFFSMDVLRMLAPQVLIRLAGQPVEPRVWEGCLTGLSREKGAILAEAPLVFDRHDIDVPVWSFSTEQTNADAVAVAQTTTLTRTKADILTNGNHRLTIETPLVSMSGLRAATASAVVGLLFDIPLPAIQTVLGDCTPPTGRLKPRYAPNGAVVLTLTEGQPHELADILWFSTLRDIDGPRILVVDEPSSIVGFKASMLAHIDHVAVNTLDLHPAASVPVGAKAYARHSDLIPWLEECMTADAAVLIVGREPADTLARLLIERDTALDTRETQVRSAAHLLIDIDAFVHNIEAMRKKNRDKMLLLQLPADALNCGVVPLAAAAFAHDVAAVSVGQVAEGIAVRQAGLTAQPVIVMGRVPPQQIKDALAHDISLTVADGNYLADIFTVAERNRTVARLHLRMSFSHDMNGIPSGELLAIVRRIVRHPFATVEGLFAEQPPTLDPANATLEWSQMTTFAKQVRAINASGVSIPYVHVSSVGDLVHGEPAAVLTATRIREFALGISPSPYTQVPSRLKRVVQWVTSIQHIDRAPEGKVIDGKPLTAEKVYAHIPVGFADGLRQGWGYAVVRGQRVPIVGASDLYRSLLDVTRLAEDVALGDTVHLIDTRLNTVEAAALRLRTDPVHILLGIKSERAYITT